jgi:hypothetical protein
MFSLLAQAYTGKESIDATNTFFAGRNIIDVVATVKPTDKLSLVLDLNSAEQKEATGRDTDSAKWASVAGYVNYQFTDMWRGSLRMEQFDDKNNYKMALAAAPVTKEKYTSATLTVAYAPSAHSEFRGEYRMDSADDEVFTKDGDPTDSVNFMAVEALYKF